MAPAKKLYYKIGEACRQLDIQPYVLRYWETEFPFLKPDKSSSGQRVYSAEELDVIRRIKELLYDEGYTIAGAKKKLDAEREGGGPIRPKGAAEEAQAEAVEAAAEDTPDEAAAESDPEAEEAAAQEPPAEPDAATARRLEELRGGLEGLLTEARGLLDELSP